MYKYLRTKDGLHYIEDTSDGAIDAVSDDDLNLAMSDGTQIEGLFREANGDITNDFGVICYKAPSQAGRNSNLSKAKKAKNDEFYTQLSDIEAELSHYQIEAFKDKVIYCPMDVAVNTGATMQSQFVKYFQMNAHLLQFKKLICTCLVERAAADGESLEEVQNCYVLERLTVPVDQRHIYGYTHGYGRNNGVVGETVDEVGRIMYDTQDGHSHKVPYHIVNQAVTEANGRIVLVKKYIDHYDEVDGHPVLGDEYTGRGWVLDGHQLTIKWCRKHPDGTIEMLPNECYFFNNGDFLSDFSIFPKDESGTPCFESVDGGSVCLYPPEYFDYHEVVYREQEEYAEYFSHCPVVAGESTKDGPMQSGDFRSEYCKKLLEDCDIVVTNPPFSLFRDFISLLISSGKKFIIIGNQNAFTYKEVFPLIKENKVWVGTQTGCISLFFERPADAYVSDKQRDYCEKHLGVEYCSVHNMDYMRMACWFTNIELVKRHEFMLGLPKSEWESRGVVYQKYDNYDAINVDKLDQIPMDYDGVMGVPITFLYKYCPEQFEIVGAYNYSKDYDGRPWNAIIGGKYVYKRLLIRRHIDAD